MFKGLLKKVKDGKVRCLFVWKTRCKMNQHDVKTARKCSLRHPKTMLLDYFNIIYRIPASGPWLCVKCAKPYKDLLDNLLHFLPFSYVCQRQGFQH